MGIIIVFYLARILAVILFISTLLSISLYPAVNFLAKRLSRGAAAALVLIGFIVCAVVVISWVVANVAPGLGKLAHEVPGFIEKVRNLPNVLPLPPEAAEHVNDALKDAANIAIEIAKSSSEALLRMASGIVELIAIPVISFYLLKDGANVMRYFTRFLARPEAQRVHQVLGEIKNMLQNYIRGQGIVSLISGVAVSMYFTVAGLPYALVFAAISAVGELAPVVGPTVAAILAATLSYAFSPSLAIETLLFYIIMLKVNHNLVYPTLIGKATKLHPVVIVSGVLFFGHIFGVLGMVIAVPVLAAVKIVFEHYAGGAASPQAAAARKYVKFLGVGKKEL